MFCNDERSCNNKFGLEYYLELEDPRNYIFVPNRRAMMVSFPSRFTPTDLQTATSKSHRRRAESAQRDPIEKWEYTLREQSYVLPIEDTELEGDPNLPVNMRSYELTYIDPITQQGVTYSYCGNRGTRVTFRSTTDPNLCYEALSMCSEILRYRSDADTTPDAFSRRVGIFQALRRFIVVHSLPRTARVAIFDAVKQRIRLVSPKD